ncbi:MAG: YicC family protein [Candidatus Omnitrophica bacterium]|nr:YicC family protein [Candidatus Omnitrophota bacterium]
MIKSMTGFGKGESKSKFGRFAVELRTVNHRYFDLSSRMPNDLSFFEDKVRNYINKYIKRGKVSVSLSLKKNGKNLNSVKLDDEAIEKYYRILSKVKRKFKLKDDVKLAHILAFPDVVVHEQLEYDQGLVWPVIEAVVRKAVLGCNAMRIKEGKALYKDLSQRIRTVAVAINKISSFAPNLILKYRDRLNARVKELTKSSGYSVDKGRLEAEVALFAKQSDITEEITRAKSHLQALKDSIVSNKETGRRLDFILQELQREVNTLGSKANSSKISRLVIDIKSEIEKIREQAQNVE